MAKHKQDKDAALAANAAAADSGDGGVGTNGSTAGDPGVDASSSSSSFKGLQAAPELTRERDRDMRDPFADDEEDDEDGSGSDGEEEREGGISGVSGWHRGGWWRGVVRSARGGGSRKELTGPTEKFGDGRDDDSDSDGAAGEEAEDAMDDEEFGDFAMPEVDAAGRQQGGASKGEAASPAGVHGGIARGNADGNLDNESSGTTTTGVSGIDPAREKMLVKPLPLHPSSNKTSASPFGSLWPFSAQGFGITAKDKDKDGKQSDATSDNRVDEMTEEPLELEAGEGMLSEDGKKIDRAVEAKRRTSIEDPDDDDDVEVGEEIIVGRGGM